MTADRKRIYLSSPHMGGQEQRYIQEAFDTNWIAPLGQNVNLFEQEVAEYAGVKGAVALSSGTAAIHLALLLLEVGRGDIVFCSSLTFIASANPIVYQGATPVFIDSEPESWNMSPAALARALADYAAKGQKPKAVVVVNLYGQSADYDALQALCEQYEVPIIEDAAESLGADYRGRKSGTFGKFGIYSFNGNKIITTSGGGMLVSEDLAALDKARFFATQAREQAKHYQHQEVGYNYRLSNVLAGIGRGQMQVLPERIEQKREIFRRYREALQTLPGIELMPEADYGRSNRWLTTALLDPERLPIHPAALIDELERDNIESRPVWKPLHLQPVFANAAYYPHEEGDDVGQRLFEQGICLPSDTNMTEEEQRFVIERIRTIL